MSLTDWTEQDTEHALRVWEEYQRHHGVSAQQGLAVGIDPDTGRVWFGTSASAIRKELIAGPVRGSVHSVLRGMVRIRPRASSCSNRQRTVSCQVANFRPLSRFSKWDRDARASAAWPKRC